MPNVPFGGPPRNLINTSYTPRSNLKSTTNKTAPQKPLITPLKPKSSRERISPMAVPKKVQTPPKVDKPSTEKRQSAANREKTQNLHDFLLSFIISLAVFGIIAVFICQALIALFM